MRNLFGMNRRRPTSGDSSAGAHLEIKSGGSLDLEIPSPEVCEFGARGFVMLFAAVVLALLLVFVLVPWGGLFGVK